MASVLRYPYEAITETTDYLQVGISSYVAAGPKLVRGGDELISSSPNVPVKKLSLNSLTKSGDVILLPMPSNIQDGNSVKYADDSLNGYVASALSSTEKIMKGVNANDWMGSVSNASNNIYEMLKGGTNPLLTQQTQNLIIKSLAAQAVSIFGGNITLDQLLARETGNIFNPNMELLFNGVTLRSFKFSFKMTPRSSKEADQCKYIIRTFKQNMAPKQGIDQNFLATPNVFDLSYKKGSDDHPFLHRFKKCALTDMNVNYTGENIYATYPDGEPISMIMDLTFRELEPIYSEDYNYADSGEGVGY